MAATSALLIHAGPRARAWLREHGLRAQDVRVLPAAAGGPKGLAEVATLLTERDHLDRTRATSPLSAAPDAVVLDTTGKPIEAVVAEVLQLAKRALSTR